jgi:ligand-binding sensor domain-containing protein
MIRIIWFLIFIFGAQLEISVSRAQYIRRESFSSEQERRARYALDDWVSYLEIKRINSMAVGHRYLYIATENGGILRYELFQKYWEYPFTTSNGLSSNRILDVAYDFGTSLLWAVTQDDTCIFKPAEQEWLCQSDRSLWPFEYPHNDISSSSKDLQQNIFYPASFLEFLPHFFANGQWTVIEDWKLMDSHFDEFPISGFLRDKWERVWFAIDGLGVGIGNQFSQRMDIVPIGLAHFRPAVVQYQQNDLWIGGKDRKGEGRPGISLWKDGSGEWEFYQARWISNLPNNNVNDIEVTGDSVWFATDYGLTVYDRRKDNWNNYDQRQGLYSTKLLDLIVHDGILYIASENGINILHLSSGLMKRIKDENVILATVYQLAAQEDTIWAATNRGILRSKSGRPWEVIRVPSAISDIPAQTVEIFKNEIWFGSPQGVFWYDGAIKKWASFPQMGLEISGPYLDLAVNEKSVWASTREGLLKYNREMNFWKIFTEEDGLISNQCFRLLLDGDFIWIANRSGITQFYWNNPARID